MIDDYKVIWTKAEESFARECVAKGLTPQETYLLLFTNRCKAQTITIAKLEAENARLQEELKSKEN